MSVPRAGYHSCKAICCFFCIRQHMERYKDFTVDPNRFPDLKQLTSELKAQGIRLVPIIDAGVKIEEGYSAMVSPQNSITILLPLPLMVIVLELY